MHPYKPSKRADRLVKMIQEHGLDIPSGKWEIRRVYAGRHQRSAGAYSFFLSWRGEIDNYQAMGWSDFIGSQFSASYIIKHGIESISMSGCDNHINPKVPE